MGRLNKIGESTESDGPCLFSANLWRTCRCIVMTNVSNVLLSWDIIGNTFNVTMNKCIKYFDYSNRSGNRHCSSQIGNVRRWSYPTHISPWHRVSFYSLSFTRLLALNRAIKGPPREYQSRKYLPLLQFKLPLLFVLYFFMFRG